MWQRGHPGAALSHPSTVATRHVMARGPPPPTHTLTHTPCAADLAQLCTKTLMALLAGGKQQ